MDDEHDWHRHEGDSRRVCRKCGLYSWWDVEREPCKKGSKVDDKYTDPDKERPPVNERAKQELGFGLLQEYDWSDK